MKLFKTLLAVAILFLLSYNSFAIDEDTQKQRIINHAEKFIAGAKFQETDLDTPTRSPAGPRLYRQVVNAVVLVFTDQGNQGSGILISTKGLIITNCHVVESAPFVGVIFKPPSGKFTFSKEDVLFAKVLKTDSLRDLAILQLVSLPVTITAVQLGNLSQVEVGQDAFSISHPEGLPWSYTEGVISQIRPKAEWKSDDGVAHKATLIQTQAVISFGSSGAPLFDGDGRLIGILVSTVGPGLNFAIAVDEVQQFTLTALERR